MSDRPIALITGASRGIGRATALALAPDYDLQLVGRSFDKLAETAVMASELGAKCTVFRTDLTDGKGTEESLKGLTPDVLINNAGVAVMKPFLELSAEEWHDQVDVNVNALFHVTRSVLPAMVARGSGHIVTIGSLAGRNTFVGGSCYAATKHFVMGFSESLMLEVRDSGVKVSVVMPGSVNTDLFPPGTDRSWMLDPEDVAKVVREMVTTPAHSLTYKVEVRPLSPKLPRG